MSHVSLWIPRIQAFWNYLKEFVDAVLKRIGFKQPATLEGCSINDLPSTSRSDVEPSGDANRVDTGENQTGASWGLAFQQVEDSSEDDDDDKDNDDDDDHHHHDTAHLDGPGSRPKPYFARSRITMKVEGASACHQHQSAEQNKASSDSDSSSTGSCDGEGHRVIPAATTTKSSHSIGTVSSVVLSVSASSSCSGDEGFQVHLARGSTSHQHNSLLSVVDQIKDSVCTSECLHDENSGCLVSDPNSQGVFVAEQNLSEHQKSERSRFFSPLLAVWQKWKGNLSNAIAAKLGLKYFEQGAEEIRSFQPAADGSDAHQPCCSNQLTPPWPPHQAKGIPGIRSQSTGSDMDSDSLPTLSLSGTPVPVEAIGLESDVTPPPDEAENTALVDETLIATLIDKLWKLSRQRSRQPRSRSRRSRTRRTKGSGTDETCSSDVSTSDGQAPRPRLLCSRSSTSVSQSFHSTLGCEHSQTSISSTARTASDSVNESSERSNTSGLDSAAHSQWSETEPGLGQNFVKYLSAIKRRIWNKLPPLSP